MCIRDSNGVDLHAFSPAAADGERAPARLLFVGRVSPDKGVHVLLDALTRVAQYHPEVELELVGDEALPRLDMQVAIDEEDGSGRSAASTVRRATWPR